MFFIMYDWDNDNYDMNCVVWLNGGWWYSGVRIVVWMDCMVMIDMDRVLIGKIGGY